MTDFNIATTEPSGPTLSEDYWQALLSQGEQTVESPGVVGVGRLDAATAGAVRLGQRRTDEQWTQLAAWMEEGRVFDAPVIGCNKGGLLVRIAEGLGFVPASQLAVLPQSLGTPDLRSDLEGMVGRDLKLRLIEIDPARDRVICSERATQWQERQTDGDRLVGLKDRVGDEVTGVVRSVCDFGVFVDLDGIDGLIHISELSWQRVRHPLDIVQPGMTLQVKVLNVDMEGRRVGLSLKRLHADPWRLVAERYHTGDVIEATVTNVVQFGAFAQVEEGVEGLIHISELSAVAFNAAEDVVREGQRIKVRILHINPVERRLGLSIRSAGL
jgi:small subunit ribosomal protein S1